MSLKQFVFSKVFLKQLGLAALITVIIIGGLWVYLNIFTKHGDHVVVPSVIGESVEDAAQTLEALDLSYQIIDSIWSKNAQGGTIVEQDPKPQAEVKSGRELYLKVYRYEPDDKIINIKEGEDEKVAMIKLKNIGVEYTVKYEANKLLEGRVIRIEDGDRNLKPGMKIKPGTEVKMYVGETKEEKVTIPNVLGKTLEEAKKMLLSSNLTLGLAFFEDVNNSEDSLAAKVYLQSPRSADGATAKSGSSVDLHLSTIDLNQEEMEDEDGNSLEP